MSGDGWGGGVLRVGDGGQPVHDVVVGVGLVDGQVDHEPVRCGAVPVLLVGLEQHAVAGTDDLDRATAALAQADALGDEDGLAQRVAVPVGARAGHEVHQVGADPGRCGRGGDGVDVDVAGNPVGGPRAVLDRAPGVLHVFLLGGGGGGSDVH